MPLLCRTTMCRAACECPPSRDWAVPRHARYEGERTLQDQRCLRTWADGLRRALALPSVPQVSQSEQSERGILCPQPVVLCPQPGLFFCVCDSLLHVRRCLASIYRCQLGARLCQPGVCHCLPGSCCCCQGCCTGWASAAGATSLPHAGGRRLLASQPRKYLIDARFSYP